MVLVYRLTLPTYVDPRALAAMKAATPAIALATRTTAAEIGGAAIQPSIDALANLRRTSDVGFGSGVRLWGDGNWSRINTVAQGVSNLQADSLGGAGGVDVGFGPARIGVSGGYRHADGNFGLGTQLKARAASVAVYGGVALPSGLYIEAAGSRTVDMKFTSIESAAAYGQTARGSTGGRVWAGGAEVGWIVPLGLAAVGPFATVDYVDARIDRFAQSGASLSNARFADLNYRRLRYGFGAELRGIFSTAVQPNVRVAYAFEDERGDRSTVASLISAQHVMGTQTIALPDTERDRLVAGGGIDGRMGRVSYRFAGEGRFDRGENEARVSVTLSTHL